MSSYFNFDYDQEFAEFNNLLFGATYTFSDDAYLTANYGLQRSPFLSAANVLIGQPYVDVEQYIKNEPYYLYQALLRTSTHEFGSLSYTHPLDEKIHLTFDVYRSMLSDMPIFDYDHEEDMGGLDSMINEVGAEYSYTSFGARLRANEFLDLDDTAIMGVRYATSEDTSFGNNTKIVMFNVSERMRFIEKLYVSPKFNISYTKNDDAEETQSRMRTSLAANYRLFRNTEIYAEFGLEEYSNLDQKNDVEGTYVYAGYTTRF